MGLLKKIKKAAKGAIHDAIDHTTDVLSGDFGAALGGGIPNTLSLLGLGTQAPKAPNVAPFAAPILTQAARSPLSLAMRRKKAGTAGVGSTFLTGAGGVDLASSNLGGNTLLGS